MVTIFQPVKSLGVSCAHFEVQRWIASAPTLGPGCPRLAIVRLGPMIQYENDHSQQLLEWH